MVLTTRAVAAQCMRELIQQRINSLKDTLAFGAAVTSFDVYKEHVGRIRGLQDAIELLDEAESEANKRQ